MNLTDCGNAAVPERLDRIRSKATARILLGAEYIFLSRPDLQLTTDRFGGSLPDGRQPEAARGTVEPRSGTKGKDGVRGAKPPQTFLERFSRGLAFWILSFRVLTCVKFEK
jgi:hypothetical protein